MLDTNAEAKLEKFWQKSIPAKFERTEKHTELHTQIRESKFSDRFTVNINTGNFEFETKKLKS